MEISVVAPDISCEHCKATIEREIGSLPGVHSVQVDVPTQRVLVNFDPNVVAETSIIARLDEEGYPAAV